MMDDRPKVVLVHSALGDSRLWRRQVAALEDRFEVVAPDLPGWGETPLPVEPFSFVDAVTAHLPGQLVGNSFGGAIALRSALAHPELVHRPQQRRALELQTAHEEPELRWPELTPLGDLDVPTLVVVGDQDKPDFLAIAQHLAEQIPGAELAVVEGAGHLVGLDRPDELNALLLEFLSGD